MPVVLDLAQPWWLLALPAAAALLALARLPWWRAARRAGRVALRREGARLAVRLVWVALLVLALAGASCQRPLQRQATVFVVDASVSVAAARDQAEAAVRAAAAALPRGDRLGVVAAGAAAGVEEAPTPDPLFHRLAAAVPGEATDLAAGLRLAGALLPAGYAGRVVLVSDGRQTVGDATAAARDLRAWGAVVDVLPLGPPALPDLRLEAVALPETAYQGEVTVLTARAWAGDAGSGRVRVYRDDELVLDRGIVWRQGYQEVALPLPVGAPGLHRYRVEVGGDADGRAENNALGGVQRVLGPPRVLVVAREEAAAGLLTPALAAAGAAVIQVTPAGVPADLAGWARYDAAFIVDVPAPAWPPGSLELLAGFVRDLGRGLVMTGGPDSFGPGGYAGTPVEQALPVYMDVRGRGREPRVAMVLVIDKSGSMGGSKIEMAKAAALRSIELLRPGDRAAVLAFDAVPQWAAGLTPVSERAQLQQAVAGIHAGGGTEIYPAVAAAAAALRDVEADVKHVILLTDGQSGSGGDYGALLNEMRAAQVTVSTVAVGEDADTTLLAAMARAGRGRYHFAADPESIPQIFGRETIMATRTLLVDQRFYPAAAGASPLLQGLAAVPPLDGYVAVTPKEQAEVALVAPEGDPVLVAWQYGSGRAVAWTPDVAGRWSSPWDGSPAATTLWGNILSWLLPPAGDAALQVRTEPAGEGAFTVTAVSADGWDEIRPTGATVLGPGGWRQEVDLAPAGPGRYAARVAVPGPGAYVVQVTQAAGGVARQAETGWVAPYPAEFAALGVDRAALERIAAAGGGRVLDAGAEAVAPAGRAAAARWPLWPLLLGLAAALWPLEIALRRLALPAGVVTAGAGRLAAALRLPRRGREAAAAGDVAAVPGQAGADAAAGTATAAGPATATAQRLLARKRALRGQRRGDG